MITLICWLFGHKPFQKRGPLWHSVRARSVHGCADGEEVVEEVRER